MLWRRSRWTEMPQPSPQWSRRFPPLPRIGGWRLAISLRSLSCTGPKSLRMHIAAAKLPQKTITSQYDYLHPTQRRFSALNCTKLARINRMTILPWPVDPERNRRSCAALPHTASTHLFEEAAAFAAVGYAKYTGRIGVCCVTSGSGGVHLLNGLTTRNVTCSQCLR